MIIDCHCHAGRGDLLSAPWNTDAPLGPYLNRARRSGIERTVVFAAFHSDYSEANEEVARIVARWPDRLTGFAFIHPSRDAGRVEEMIDRAVRQHRFRGIKVHGFDAPPTREVCDAAQSYGLPILIDVVGQAQLVDMFAPAYPEIPFIIPHLGSFKDDFRAQQQVVDQLVRLPNVYADTSGVRRFDYLLQAVRRAGARKLLFGSDGPWLHPGHELQKVKWLGLSPADYALVTGGNARRLIFGPTVGRRRARAYGRATKRFSRAMGASATDAAQVAEREL